MTDRPASSLRPSATAMAALANLAATLALTCTAVFAYGLAGPHIGWMSDDALEVFGASSPVPDWRTAFQIGGDGHWSPYRRLKYPIQGYVGAWLGPSYTHVRQFMGHVFCVHLFYRLSTRLKWPLDVQWRWTLLAAAEAFHSAPGVLVLAAQAAVLLLLGAAWVRTARHRADPRAAIAPVSVPVWESLILGWSLLPGSRVVLLLVGSVSRVDTRLAYGASLGVAVAGVALVAGVVQHPRAGVWLRGCAGLLVLAAVLLLGAASAGVGVHYVRTAAAEASTIRTLEHWLAAHPFLPGGPTNVVVAPRRLVPQGATDLSYLNELNGVWLDFVMKQRCPGCEVFVVPQVECLGAKDVIRLSEGREGVRAQVAPNGTVPLGDDVRVFRWTGQAL